MKKISQGKFEIFTTKADAIDKFMQMQGICREEISDENPIQFYCTKKGKITITDPPRRNVENQSSTSLFAEIVQQQGKTYVTYYTAFDKLHNIFSLIYIVIYLLIAVLAIIFTIASNNKIYYLPILLLGVLFFGRELFIKTKQEENSPNDSEILIKELEKRVEAVNLWNK